MAAGDPGGRESACRRHHRLLSRRGCERAGEDADSGRRGRRGALVLERGPGDGSASSDRSREVRADLRGGSDDCVLSLPALLARAADGDLDQGGDAQGGVGSALSARGRQGERGNGGDRRRTRPQLSGSERAVGAAGEVSCSADRERQDVRAAAHAAPRPARQDAGRRPREARVAFYGDVQGRGCRARSIRGGAHPLGGPREARLFRGIAQSARRLDRAGARR